MAPIVLALKQRSWANVRVLATAQHRHRPSSARRCRTRREGDGRCRVSRVCGIADSSAATTRTTASMPPAPASIFFTNRSWPGTSTNASSRRRSPGREAEIDRDAARLLLFQAIRIGPGQRAHERALAVIDMPRSPNRQSISSVSCVFVSVFSFVFSCISRLPPSTLAQCRSRRPGRWVRLPRSSAARGFCAARVRPPVRARESRRGRDRSAALHVDANHLHLHLVAEPIDLVVFSPRSMCALSTNR